MQIHSLFSHLSLSEKHADIFLLIYKYGPKPASTIASMVNMERTHVYKLIQWLLRKYLVAESTIAWVKQFFVADKKVIHHLLDQQRKQLDELESLVPLVEQELTQLDSEYRPALPKIQFWQGRNGIQTALNDLTEYTIENKFVIIKLLASNTLESQSFSQQQFKDITKQFFQRLQANHVSIESYLGNGVSILEHIVKSHDIAELESLPAGNSSLNLFVVGNCVYVIIHKHTPFALKIENEELAEIMHFVLKQLW